MKWILLFLFAPYLVAAQDISVWLENQSIDLVSSKPIEGRRTFKEVGNYLEGVQVLGLGETSHGQGSFFEMKHALFKYLVEEKGYKVFALEAGFVECQKINDYIRNEKGDAVSALKYLNYGVWEVQEYVDLIEWIRIYNKDKSAEEKISFYGIDCQMSHGAVDYVRSLSKSLHFTLTLKDSTLLQKLSELEKTRNREIAQDLMKSTRQLCVRIKALISQSDFDSTQKKIAIFNCEALEQFCFNETSKSDTTRASFMASNIQNILKCEGPNTKIAVSAHNGHIYKSSKQKELGTYLNTMFREKYYAVGFEFNSGDIQGFRFQNYATNKVKMMWVSYHLKPAKKNSFGDVLLGCQKEAAFMDLRKGRENKSLPSWFLVPQTCGKILGCYGLRLKEEDCNSRYWRINISESYDGIIFIRSTQRSNHI